MNNRPLFIPVVLGTVRKGRASENVAKFVFEQVKQREGVETEFVDIGELKSGRRRWRADQGQAILRNV